MYRAMLGVVRVWRPSPCGGGACTEGVTPRGRPDVEPVEPARRNRNSMIALGHQSKLDFPWLQ
ncbi:hypothetical protein EYF80_034374 [Liparis tanakae]|uniref:Uncharacterized protein n=1 Tax=Liparis tanakae TaxID=230148 RepID=A0A4Z2GRX6_9TELE|nr:hypothetical protein EYF80_034374 [Liparis tanakae]